MSSLRYRLTIRAIGTGSALGAVYCLTVQSYYSAALLVMVALENVIELAILYAAKELRSQKPKVRP